MADDCIGWTFTVPRIAAAKARRYRIFSAEIGGRLALDLVDEIGNGSMV